MKGISRAAQHFHLMHTPLPRCGESREGRKQDGLGGVKEQQFHSHGLETQHLSKEGKGMTLRNRKDNNSGAGRYHGGINSPCSQDRKLK